MKKLLALAVILAAVPARADITHKIQSSISLTVDGAGSVAEKIGSSYSVSGTNVTLNTAGGLGALTTGNAVGYTAADYSVTTAGDAFSFTETYNEGDNALSPTTVTSGVVGTLPVYGKVTTTAGGVAGNLAGTISPDFTTTITAGGAGTSAVSQFVSELLID